MPSFLRKLFESSHRWLQDASQVTSSANTTVKLPRQALGKRFKSKKKPQEAGTQPGTTVSLPPALLPGIVRVSGTLTSDLRGNAHFETIIPPGQVRALSIYRAYVIRTDIHFRLRIPSRRKAALHPHCLVAMTTCPGHSSGPLSSNMSHSSQQ